MSSQAVSNSDRRSVAKLIIGCGYLGMQIAKRWLAAGQQVHALTRGRLTILHQAGIQPIVGDILDPASLRSLPAADTVVYAVGLDRSAGYSMQAVYVQGLRNVLDHLPRPERLVYISSTSVYGNVPGIAVDECSPTQPDEASGKVVLEAENLLRSRYPDAGVLRLAGIYGPGRLLREASIRRGEPIAGDPQRLINLIQVEDAASVVLAALEQGGAGLLWNVSDGQPVSRRELYGFLAQMLDAPAPVFASNAPADPGRAIRNQRMLQASGLRLAYPSYRDGILAALGRVHGTA